MDAGIVRKRFYAWMRARTAHHRKNSEMQKIIAEFEAEDAAPETLLSTLIAMSCAFIAAVDANSKAAAAEKSVYFVQEKADGPIKIGCSCNVGRRASALSSQGNRDLFVLATEPGGVERERELHRLFAADRLKGEWFAPSQRLLEHIGRVRAKAAEL